MAGMLVSSLATPGAFGADGLLFAGAYFVVRVLHLVLFYVGSEEHGTRRAVARLAPPSMIGSGLLIVAGLVSGGTLRDALWCVALAIDYLGPVIGGVSGWRVSAGHFAERHGLIVLIALGESVIAVGAASGRPLGPGVVIAGILGVALAGALWWAYFDVVALVAERRLRSLTGVRQNRVARDSYSFLHLVMIAGIILVALGIKQTLAGIDAPLSIVATSSLYGGVALYLTGHILFRLRNVRTLNKQRVVVGLAVLALIPLARTFDALAALAMVTTVACALIAYEAIRFSDARQRVRHAGVAQPPS
jgi:low temperature requirement protein LtrA